MLGIFVTYSLWTIISAMRQARDEPQATIGDDPGVAARPMGWPMIAACFAGGLALLSFGGSFASDGASGAAIASGCPRSRSSAHHCLHRYDTARNGHGRSGRTQWTDRPRHG